MTDLQRVWRLVQDLSTQLKVNQQETVRLRRYIELNPPFISPSKILTSNNDSVRAETNGSKHEMSQLEHAQAMVFQLRHEYSILMNENDTLKRENDEISQLCAEYEFGLAKALEQIRSHEYEVTQSTLNLHRNYASQIDAAQEINRALKAETVEMQDQIHKLSTLIRNALENYSDVDSEIVIEALRIENEALRSRLGEMTLDEEKYGTDRRMVQGQIKAP